MLLLGLSTLRKRMTVARGLYIRQHFHSTVMLQLHYCSNVTSQCSAHVPFTSICHVDHLEMNISCTVIHNCCSQLQQCIFFLSGCGVTACRPAFHFCPVEACTSRNGSGSSKFKSQFRCQSAACVGIKKLCQYASMSTQQAPKI